MEISKHYSCERQSREDAIRLIGEGKPFVTFEVDRGHKNGPEIHKISDTGIITIFNKNSGKLITKLIARPGQIDRYYWEQGLMPPTFLMNQARRNVQLGLNLL